MVLYHIIILALIQGITEFLPVSSSGHLVLAHHLMSGETIWGEDLMMDVAVHVGTLASVLIYFRRDVQAMLCGALCFAKGKKKPKEQQLVLYILAASVPVIMAGFLLHAVQPGWIRSVQVMAWATLLFGILLWWVDRQKPTDRTLDHMTMKDAVMIGLAQVLALIPGTSRSGITMTAARWYGFSRVEAARFSLFLAMVAISGAGTLGGIDLIQSGDANLSLHILLAVILAFLSGLAAIHLMMKWLARASFTPFAIYRVVLGIVLLALIYSGTLS